MNTSQYKIKAEFDFDSKSLVGTVSSDDLQGLDVKQQVFNSISGLFDDISNNATKDIRELINSAQYEEAFLSAKESLSGFVFLKEDYYHALKELSTYLSDNQLKEICIYLVAFSSQFCLIDELEGNIEICFRLKDDSMSELEEMSLYIEKARVFYEKGSFNASNAVLQEVIKKTKNNMILGCAFRGLARLAIQNEDFEFYSNKAIDNFIISGNKKEAIQVIFKLIERMEGKNNVMALELINKAIELQSSDTYIDKGYYSALLQRKGIILINSHKYHDAKEPLLMACSLRRGMLGQEEKLYECLVKAEVVLRLIDENEEADKLKEESQGVEKLIKNDICSLTKKIMDSIELGDVADLDGDKILCDKSVSPHMKYGYLMIKYLNGGYEFSHNIELLDKALGFANESIDYKAKAMVFKEMAIQYEKNDYTSIAIEKLYESIGVDPESRDSFQYLIYLLLQERRLDEACVLLRNKIELFGFLPNLTFTYAKALFDNKNYKEAYKHFRILEKQGGVDIIDGVTIVSDYIRKCLDNIDELDVVDNFHVHSHEHKIDISLNVLSSAFNEFSASLSSHSRMQYWIKDDVKGYKWNSSPETIAKGHLLSFLSGKFGGDLELIQEDRAGAGFIDLYLIAKNGVKFVVELKMCGYGYSSTYAISGESQIIHYLQNKDTKVGFLIVFDSRTRDFSKGLDRFKTYENFSIYTTIVDVRNTIEK